MGNRHDVLGIKQAIRLEWMQKTVNLMLAGLDSRAIRYELHDFLSNATGAGCKGERSDKTRTFVVNNLMNIWVLPGAEVLPFRDASLEYLQENPSQSLAIHWGMICAAYPFWFRVARQVGRLLSLQNQFTQAQVIYRIKELYGDRQTVARYSRYVLRSFVYWNVIRDSVNKGRYQGDNRVHIADPVLVSLMIEAMLYAVPEKSAHLGELREHPSLFPFDLMYLDGDAIARVNSRLELSSYAASVDLLRLKRL